MFKMIANEESFKFLTRMFRQFKENKLSLHEQIQFFQDLSDTGFISKFEDNELQLRFAELVKEEYVIPTMYDYDFDVNPVSVKENKNEYKNKWH